MWPAARRQNAGVPIRRNETLQRTAGGCKAVAVVVPSAPPRELGPLFRIERTRLLDVLRSLGASDWDKPSPCPGWSVLGLATHLLGGDFSLLAWQRDRSVWVANPGDHGSRVVFPEFRAMRSGLSM
jgi:hypothetical protein